MSLHLDLLEQAGHLASREATRPRQASLRRAVSTAYYALFHCINAEAVAIVGPHLFLVYRARVQRWFSHAEMKRICSNFLVQTFTRPVSLAGLTPTADLQTVARNFIRLQEVRHSADYDLATVWTRIGARQHVQMAQDAIEAWTVIRDTEEANLFILALLLWKNFEVER